jgi:hypothetical protein
MKIYINNSWENYSLHLIRRQAQDVTELGKVCNDEERPKSAQGKELRKVQCLMESRVCKGISTDLVPSLHFSK